MTSATIRRRVRRAMRPSNLPFNAAMVILSLGVLLPILWAVSASFKGTDETYQAVPSLIVQHPTLINYEYMLNNVSRAPLYFLNSLIVSFGTVAVVVAAASLAGYAFARMEWRGRDAVFLFLMMMMFVPRSGGLMALFELMSFLHLRNSLVGLILLFSAGLTVPIFIMRQTFLSLPRELEDAARIDGADWFEVFRSIAVPLAAPGMVVVALFTFVGAWGDFLVTLTMIDRDNLNTLAIGMNRAMPNLGDNAAVNTFTGRFSPYGSVAALQLTTMAPVVLLWIFLQRWFMRGLAEGILKF